MSTPLDKFLLLVGEINAPLDVDPAFSLNDDPRGTRWELILGGGSSLILSYLPEKQSLLISTTLGEPYSPKHYQPLLYFNGLHEVTGGVRFGLTHPTGEIVMHFETPLDVLTLDGLKTLVFNLVSSLTIWREVVNSEPGAVEMPPAGAQEEAGMRV